MSKPKVTPPKPARERTWSIPSRRVGMPERVGRYRLVRRICRGGMGQVYEAFLEGEGGFARRFAVKMPLPGTPIQELAAFADEARILSQLHHPGIVGVVDFGTHEGWPYQVLEYVDGPNLDLLRLLSGPLDSFPATLALIIVLRAARALHFAHEAVDWEGRQLGIIHRDVSPQNILVTWSGEVKLIDFGIAKAEGRLARTEEGTVKGKLLYMAPEQIGGQRVTPRADVFSLGCVLYFLLTGDSPYALVEDHTKVARDLRPTRLGAMDAELASIVEKAIALRPDGRHATALELANDCERALARRPDATAAALQRCLENLRGAVPQNGVRRLERNPSTTASLAGLGTLAASSAWPSPDRPHSVMVVGIDPREEAPTVANLDLVRFTQAAATAASKALLPDEGGAEGGASVPSATRDAVFGRFRVLSPLPFGEHVYEAAAGDDDAERVALKRIECERRGAEDVARRLADAAAMSTVDHDHLIRVLEFGVDAGSVFIVVPELRGHTLLRVMRDAGHAGGLSADELSALATGLILAVRAASHVAHSAASAEIARDVRPETFLVGHDGFPKLMDTIVDGPLHGVRFGRMVEAQALGRLISTLPPALGAGGALGKAIEHLRDDSSPSALSWALLTLRHGGGHKHARPPSRILADLMLRLYGAEAARAQSDLSRALRAPSVVSDTASMPSLSIEIDEDEHSLTELDPDALQELVD